MKKFKLPQLLDLLWQDYISTNPPAQSIHNLFTSAGEKVVNDHIAFRTFNHPKISVDVLGAVFVGLGYEEKDDYQFEKKKLYAKHYEHPDSEMPLIFISQLKTEEFDRETQKIIQSLTDQIPADFTTDPSFVCQGRPWKLDYSDYVKLKEVSEYAAWLSAFGFRVNHFTVSINHLKNYKGIIGVNQFLKDSGFELNSAGGEVKGTPAELLEQSSTIAYNKEVDFGDGMHVIPACYYEFAMRYPKPDGSLFRGFIAGSADKIFESTDKGQDYKK
jgi:hypothetical protein